ncbi:hypothetical protein [Magnetovibrio blakemorei]|uniref:Uncharacterized protein n=1 Tax=Magnetovibrio blakemorei TaxID=28181 RepID=A0A1E5QB85_9PROT|nr:hypothetical protein [Magnetovibrio blakemorei]OEJ69290.1 hypothetical protein BEN30_04215 [Magnetovibrio blakemorei]
MTEHSKVLVGENTREQIAYKLLDKIFVAEGKTLTSRNREDILRTYVQCYSAAGGVYMDYEDTA